MRRKTWGIIIEVHVSKRPQTPNPTRKIKNLQSTSTTSMYSPSEASVALAPALDRDATDLVAVVLFVLVLVAVAFAFGLLPGRVVWNHGPSNTFVSRPNSLSTSAAPEGPFSICRGRFRGREVSASSLSLASNSQRLRISSSVLFSIEWNEAWWLQPSHS